MILDLCFQMFRQIALQKGNLDETKKRSSAGPAPRVGVIIIYIEESG